MPCFGGVYDGKWELLPFDVFDELWRGGEKYTVHVFVPQVEQEQFGGVEYWFAATDDKLRVVTAWEILGRYLERGFVEVLWHEPRSC